MQDASTLLIRSLDQKNEKSLKIFLFIFFDIYSMIYFLRLMHIEDKYNPRRVEGLGL